MPRKAPLSLKKKRDVKRGGGVREYTLFSALPYPRTESAKSPTGGRVPTTEKVTPTLYRRVDYVSFSPHPRHVSNACALLVFTSGEACFLPLAFRCFRFSTPLCSSLVAFANVFGFRLGPSSGPLLRLRCLRTITAPLRPPRSGQA